VTRNQAGLVTFTIRNLLSLTDSVGPAGVSARPGQVVKFVAQNETAGFAAVITTPFADDPSQTA
jgi:hypothetical protein